MANKKTASIKCSICMCIMDDTIEILDVGNSKITESLVCKKCENNLIKFKIVVHKIANDLSISLPEGIYYRYGVSRCWNCKKEMIVFAWPTDGLWDNNKPKNMPLPQGVKFIEKMGYWGNVCSACDKLQGDFHLKMEPDSALFGAKCEDDSEESFNADILMIAHNASLDGILD